MVEFAYNEQLYGRYARLTLCLFLSFIVFSSAASGAQHTISSLPYTVTTAQNGDTLVLSGNLSSPGTGITFSGGVHDIYLRGRGDTIIFNTSGNDSERGIYFPSGVQYNIKIDSLTIIQYSDQGSSCMGFGVKSIHDVKIYDCNVHVKGFDCRNFYHYSDVKSYNVEIRGGNWTSFVNSFSSRCQNSAAAMDLGYGDPDNGDYSYWVHNIAIDSCPHTGVLASGVGWVDSCVLWGNAHNDYYDYPSTNVCWSADNPYMVAIGGYPGSRATHNIIRARDGREGARGIFVSGCRATEENPLVIAYNDIQVSNGPSDYPGARPATRGIRIREGESTPYLQNVHVHDNYVVVVADTLSSTSHIGSDAAAIQAMNFSPNTHDIYIYNNVFISLGDTTGGYGDGGGGVYASASDGYSEGYNLVSYNNRYVSNGTCLGLSGIGPNWGVGNWTFIGDTLEWVAPGYKNRYNLRGIVGLGYDASEAINNVIRDVVYIGYDGGLDSNAMDFSGMSTKDILHQKTLRVFVYGNNDLPVPGASIWAVNNYGDTVLAGISGSQGFV
jgi:hypothetical protein